MQRIPTLQLTEQNLFSARFIFTCLTTYGLYLLILLIVSSRHESKQIIVLYRIISLVYPDSEASGFPRMKSRSHNIVLISRSSRIGRVHNNRGFRIGLKRLVGDEWLRTDYTPQKGRKGLL